MEGSSRSSPSSVATSSGDRSATCSPRVLWIDLNGIGPGRIGPRGGEPRDVSFGEETPEGGLPSLVLQAPRPLSKDSASRLAAWGGTALGLVLLAAAHEGLGSEDPEPLVLAVGSAVGRRVPTAARASVLARAPHTGLLGLGQVGSELGAILAQVADALVIRGRIAVPGAVLVIDSKGARIEVLGDLVGLEPAQRIALCRRDIGAGATLTFGPAAEAGVPFASLAAGPVFAESGGGRPSLVGRGGLGAVLAGSGLSAIHLLSSTSTSTGTGVEASQPAANALLNRALRSSPRLAQRSQSGSMELFGAEGARASVEHPVTPSEWQAESLKPVQRSGCRGCPTPCGWSFQRAPGEDEAAASPQPGRFAALRSVGRDLGLTEAGDSLELLANCDAHAVDAKELGTLLELLILAQELGRLDGSPAKGKLNLLLRWSSALLTARSLGQDDWTEQERSLLPIGRGGASTLALHLIAGNSATQAAGLGATQWQAVRRIANREPREARARDVNDKQGSGISGGLAMLLGQCTSTGGADPMRTFPFLLEILDREALEQVTSTSLPLGADDPELPAGKGTLAWWHQNLVAGIDLTGFCAFSAAGLLADGVVSLDELAEFVLPPALLEASEPAWASLSPGGKLLAAGENVALLARALDDRWSRIDQRDRPDWAAERLDHPELLPTYRRLRGIGFDGLLKPQVLDGLGLPVPGLRRHAPILHHTGPSVVAFTADSAGSRSQEGVAKTQAGALESTEHGVLLRSQGPLQVALLKAAVQEGWVVRPDGIQCPLEEPQSMGEFLRALTQKQPHLSPLLLAGTRIMPAVWRSGRRLRADALLSGKDVLDLVLAIPGG